MRITADTNLLVRIIVRDDARQAQIAFRLVSTADRVVIPLPCLCEVAWVLESVYGFDAEQLEMAIRSITDPRNALVDRAAVGVGFQMLQAGGDFADGVIASAGEAQGGDVFVSFDRKAVTRLDAIGVAARDARDFA